MVLLSLIAAVLFNQADRWLPIGEALEFLGIPAIKPSGGRTIFSTLSASAITVASVVFSINIAAIANVTSQFGPRLLTSFMEDRGNQITLGIFLGTFAYGMVGLSFIRDPSESAGGGYVSQIALLVGMVTGLLSIGGLIWFIHHVADSLRVHTQLAAIGQRLQSEIEKRFPKPYSGTEPDADYSAFNGATEYTLQSAGYVDAINYADLVKHASTCDIRIRMLAAPGDFVCSGEAVAAVIDGEIDEAVLAEAISLSRMRSLVQDVTYMFDELCEVAIRALSPGINDPFTAGSAFNWIVNGLVLLGNRQMPGGVRSDDDGCERLWLRQMHYADVAENTLDQLRDYFATDRNALLQMLSGLAECCRQIEPTHRHALFVRAADEVCRIAQNHLHPIAIQEMERAKRRVGDHQSDSSEDESPRAG